MRRRLGERGDSIILLWAEFETGRLECWFLADSGILALTSLTPPSFGAAKRGTEWGGLAALTAGTALGTGFGTCEIAETLTCGGQGVPA